MSATQNKGSEASGRPLRSSARGRKIPATEFPSGGGPGDLGLAPFLMSVQVKHDRTDIFSLSATISMFFCFFLREGQIFQVNKCARITMFLSVVSKSFSEYIKQYSIVQYK